MAKLIYAHQRIPRRLHRGRNTAPSTSFAPDDDVFACHNRPAALRRHVPLRAAALRDDGRLGDRPRPRRAVRPHGRLRERLAGGDKVVYSTTLAAVSTGRHPARTPLRPRRGKRTQGRSHAATSSSAGANLAARGLRSRPGRRVPAVRLAHDHRRRQAGAAERRSAPASSSSTSADSKTASYFSAIAPSHGEAIAPSHGEARTHVEHVGPARSEHETHLHSWGDQPAQCSPVRDWLAQASAKRHD